jgi:hypothetical protein
VRHGQGERRRIVPGSVNSIGISKNVGGAMDKWEYCTVGPLGSRLDPLYKEDYCQVWYLTDQGVNAPNEFALPYIDHDPVHFISQMMWLLGEAGWELVGMGAANIVVVTEADPMNPDAVSQEKGKLGHMLYFKRKKQE